MTGGSGKWKWKIHCCKLTEQCAKIVNHGKGEQKHSRHLTWTGVTGVNVLVIAGTLGRRHQQVVCRLWRDDPERHKYSYMDKRRLQEKRSLCSTPPSVYFLYVWAHNTSPSPTHSPDCHKHLCLLQPPVMAGCQNWRTKARRRKEERPEKHWLLFKSTTAVIVSYSLDFVSPLPSPFFTPPLFQSHHLILARMCWRMGNVELQNVVKPLFPPIFRKILRLNTQWLI